MPLALEMKVPGRHGRGLKPRKQNSPAWRHTGGLAIWSVRTGVSLLSCLQSVFLSNHPFPHRWTSSLPSVRVQPWAQLVSFSGATQCMRQVW